MRPESTFTRVRTCLLSAALLLAPPLLGAEALPRKVAWKETYPGLAVEYGTVAARGGPRLRSVVTRPAAAAGRLPALLLVGWLSCDTVEADPIAPGATIKVAPVGTVSPAAGRLYFSTPRKLYAIDLRTKKPLWDKE